MIWVKYKSGVIWGYRGQKVIFSKNATSATEYMVLSALCNIVYPCYHVTHKYALTWDSELHSLVQGQLGITSADRVRRLWRQHVSSSFFFLLLTICFFFHMLDWIFIKLGQKHVWVNGYKTYGFKNSCGVIWGHRGQKCHFTKNATPPTDYRQLSRD